MSKLIGIFIIVMVLFSAGLSYFTFSAYERKSTQTKNTLAVLTQAVEGLQKELDALKGDVAPLSASQHPPIPADQNNDGTDPPSFSRKLSLLENETLKLRTLIEDKINADTNDTSFQQSSTYEYLGNDGDEPIFSEDGMSEQAEAENHRLNETLAQLDAVMLNDEFDPQWTEIMTERIGDVLSAVADPADSGIAINSYDCKSALCRIEAVVQDPDQSDRVEEVILDNLSDELPQMISTRDDLENGNTTITFYLVREGNTVEQLLLSQ